MKAAPFLLIQTATLQQESALRVEAVIGGHPAKINVQAIATRRTAQFHVIRPPESALSVITAIGVKTVQKNAVKDVHIRRTREGVNK